MRPEPECGTCLSQWMYRRAAADLEPEGRLEVLETVVAAIGGAIAEGLPLGPVSNRGTDAAFALRPGDRDRYRDARSRSNDAARSLLPAAREFLDQARDGEERFRGACKMAALANVAPLGPPGTVLEFGALRGLLGGNGGRVAVRGDLFAAAQGARRVLYAADNAGEVGFDGLLIEELLALGARVTLVVKDPPFFEDATPDDARWFGLDARVGEMRSVDGFLTPAGEAGEILEGFDLVVAKGTGSFEALFGELGDRPGIFLLKAKCGPVARALGVARGEFAAVLSR